ncbi:hypothetical protein [Deferrisoma palaeochoriense]
MRKAERFSNPWKRTGVFACDHVAHQDFAGSVSPYHVLREKGCYPRGCLYFRWRCKRLEKGKRCKRKFRHVGRLCRGCPEYDEEKVHQQPRLLLTPGQWLDFRRELEEFERWFDETVGRRVEVSGEVAEVKPSFVQEVDAGSRVHYRGFLVVLAGAHLGWTRIDAPVYLRVSRAAQDRHGFRAGDRIECLGEVAQDHGRIVIRRVGRVEFGGRGTGRVWTAAEGLVAKAAATAFSHQPETCLRCPGGTLLDVYRDDGGGVRHHRRLLCLEGLPSPELCPRWYGAAGRALGR